MDGDGGSAALIERMLRNMTGALRYVYGWSVVGCLPAAMGDPETAATGAVMRPATLRRYAAEAGFAGVEVLPVEAETFRFYLLTR
jgi:hypothetical protein